MTYWLTVCTVVLVSSMYTYYVLVLSSLLLLISVVIIVITVIIGVCSTSPDTSTSCRSPRLAGDCGTTTRSSSPTPPVFRLLLLVQVLTRPLVTLSTAVVL